MDERVEISLLLDFYGKLLTEKQNMIMDMYYNDDLSLSEIAEINQTSRQAIHDLIKRCYKQLLSYEEKLCLLKNGVLVAKKKEEIIYQLNKLKDKNKENEIDIKKIIELINETL